MKPYYDDGRGIQIFHGDCREVLPTVTADVLMTDPPYGIGAARCARGGKQHGAAMAPSKDYGINSWDDYAPPASVITMAIAAAHKAIIWGGNYFALPPMPGWLVWDKDNGANGYADCELAWTNLDQAVRRKRYRWMGMFQERTGADKEVRLHPTQKPLEVMLWCLGFCPVGAVLDPWMGSGTTLVAAKNLGRRAIGIEIEERYCEIAAKRLSQQVLDFAPTETKQAPEQIDLIAKATP